MVRPTEPTRTTMFVRRNSTTANGFVQQRNPRQRRRNAVANIFSELTEGDVRTLREQAKEMLHPAAMGATPPGSSSDSSSSEDVTQSKNLPRGERRRRNALHDIGVGIDHAELQHLREQAQTRHHPATMMTTPPGAPGDGGADGAPRRTPRSVSMLLTTTATEADEILWNPDETGASSGLESGPSTTLTVDSVSLATHPSGAFFPRSISAIDGASSQSHCLSTAVTSDVITTLTETDGDIFRERISRSSTRYRERRNAVCYEDSTQVFLNNIISAVMRCRQQRREAAANRASRLSESD